MIAPDYHGIYERLRMPLEEITKNSKNLDEYLEQAKADIDNLSLYRSKLIETYTDQKVAYANDWINKNAPEEISQLIRRGFEIERNRNHEMSICLKLQEAVFLQTMKLSKDTENIKNNIRKSSGSSLFLLGVLFCIVVNVCISLLFKK